MQARGRSAAATGSLPLSSTNAKIVQVLPRPRKQSLSGAQIRLITCQLTPHHRCLMLHHLWSTFFWSTFFLEPKLVGGYNANKHKTLLLEGRTLMPRLPKAGNNIRGLLQHLRHAVVGPVDKGL